MNRFVIVLQRLALAAFFSGCSGVFAQNGGNSLVSSTDSVSLNKIISIVIQNHPSVKEGAEAINSAGIGVELAKTGYYPGLDVTANYTRIGPLESISFPGFGTFDMYPANNYTANLNFQQSIYDFGRTKQNITVSDEVKNLATQSLEQIRQKLAIATITHFYSLLYLQEAILINQEEQNTLKEHLAFVQKKNETGSATQYEVLTTKVKLSSAESAGIELTANLRDQITELNTLMGQGKNTSLVVKKETDIRIPDKTLDSLIGYSMSHRDEMLIANKKTTIAGLKYNIVKAQNYPSLLLYATGGAKNGYLPDLDKIKANFTAGAGLKIPVFDGMRTKYNLMIAKSTIQTYNDETDLTRLNIINDVVESQENLKSSQEKVDHYALQLSQAKEAFTLAQTSYKAGSITNLDLLDAATAVSESKLLLYKSKIEFVMNAFKLKASIGERLY